MAELSVQQSRPPAFCGQDPTAPICFNTANKKVVEPKTAFCFLRAHLSSRCCCRTVAAASPWFALSPKPGLPWLLLPVRIFGRPSHVPLTHDCSRSKNKKAEKTFPCSLELSLLLLDRGRSFAFGFLSLRNHGSFSFSARSSRARATSSSTSTGIRYSGMRTVHRFVGRSAGCRDQKRDGGSAQNTQLDIPYQSGSRECAGPPVARRTAGCREKGYTGSHGRKNRTSSKKITASRKLHMSRRTSQRSQYFLSSRAQEQLSGLAYLRVRLLGKALRKEVYERKLALSVSQGM